MVGDVISHYRVLERLGEGGMGEVFLVEDLKLHRKAALKLIAADLTRNEERRQRFVQEATLAASIDHPHIAAIYDIDEADGRTFIVMEYVQGRSLREMLKNGPITPRRAIELAAQIADALAKVHERGVVHRDLKPENVLVAEEGYAKVIDFGVAKLADPLKQAGLVDAGTMTDVQVRTADGLVLGTMAYMSPEQARGEAVDARSDIFSFGALLQEMLTGTPPFRRRSAAETLSAILTLPPAPVQVSAGGAETDLQRVIRKCLVKEPAGRYQSMRDVVVDLREVRDSMGSGTTTGHAAPAIGNPRARTLIQAGAAVGVVAVIATTALWMWGRDATVPVASRETASRPAIAVLAFDVISAGPNTAWLGKGLPSMLVTGLAQTPDLEVVGLERLSDAAKQMGAANLEAVERTQLSELARRAGAQFVVIGSLVQAGDEIRIDARVEDLTNGGVRFAQSVRGRDALTLADDLAARIRSGFNVQPTSEVRKVADLASSSVDAYRLYTDGVEALNNAEFERARTLLLEATRIDSGFAMAHQLLALIADFLGQEAEQRQHLDHAAQHVNRLTERDALLVRGSLARGDGRPEEAERLFESVVSRYPDTEIAYVHLTTMFVPFIGATPDLEKALRAAERGVRALPYAPGVRNLLGYAKLYNGRFDEAIDELEVYVKLRPNVTNPIDSLAEAHLVSGNVHGAIETYGRIAARTAGARAGRAWSNAVLGRYDQALIDVPQPVLTRWFLISRLGRYREAQRQIAVERNQPDVTADIERLTALELLEAQLALERGDCARVARLTDAGRQVAARSSELRQGQWLIFADTLSGTCDARSGRLDQARATLAHARQRHAPGAPHERWWVHALEGEIALASGDPGAAARSFSTGEPAGKMIFLKTGRGVPLSFFANNLVLRDGRARAAAAAGRTDEAIVLYRALLTPGRENKWTAMLDPRHVLALARVLDKAGQRDAARAEYQRFLDLWKDADRDLPELAEARGRL